MNKIIDFTDLVVWQKAHELVLAIYKTTKSFPSVERMGLVSQMQRAVVSITSNIAEGFTRRSKKEKLQFYYTALGSLSELRNQELICRDLGYIHTEEFNQMEEKMVTVRKLLNGLIKSSNDFNS